MKTATTMMVMRDWTAGRIPGCSERELGADLREAEPEEGVGRGEGAGTRFSP
jgi:hypothetical protein